MVFQSAGDPIIGIAKGRIAGPMQCEKSYRQCETSGTSELVGEHRGKQVVYRTHQAQLNERQQPGIGPAQVEQFAEDDASPTPAQRPDQPA